MNLSRKVLVVTDSGVPQQYLSTVLAQCPQGVPVVLEQGEGSKSLAVTERLCTAMLQHGFARTDAVLALGGGVVGDAAGFAAACYMRGIDFINCPTTTLAQVDSSIGGKTAVNLAGTKNIVGAFHQPCLAVSYTHLDVYKRQGRHSAAWCARQHNTGPAAAGPFWRKRL